MRIAIAGAGNVGRSIASELIGNGHQVMLIERQPRQLRDLLSDYVRSNDLTPIGSRNGGDS